MSLLKVNNLYLKKGKSSLLNDINFELSHGEIMLLTGVPGSGKSILLKILAGVIRSYSGVIEADESVKKKKMFGYLPAFKYLNSRMSGKDFALEYLYLNRNPVPGETLMEIVKIFTAFDHIELLRKHLNDMTLLEQKIYFMILLLCLGPELILIDELVDEEILIPQGFLDDYVRYLKENGIACIMASRIKNIIPFDYDNLLLLHNGWMVYAARKEQIEKQLEGFILRLKPPELEKFFRGKEEVDHKIYLKEENAMDIILKKNVLPGKLIQEILSKNNNIEAVQIFKPNIMQFLKYKLEEFNIVE